MYMDRVPLVPGAAEEYITGRVSCQSIPWHCLFAGRAIEQGRAIARRGLAAAALTVAAHTDNLGVDGRAHTVVHLGGISLAAHSLRKRVRDIRAC